MEIVAPSDAIIQECDNEIGTIEQRDGQWIIIFKQLLAENGKVWDQIHSGNLNRFKLPTQLPQFTFFRIPATEEMGIGTKC
jgi:putative protease